MSASFLIKYIFEGTDKCFNRIEERSNISLIMSLKAKDLSLCNF